MTKALVFCFCLCLANACVGAALDAKVSVVDIEFAALADSAWRASVDVTWQVESSSMGGFYYQTPLGAGDIDPESAYAIINGKTRIPLAVTKVDENRFDLDLEDQKRFAGSGVFHFEFDYVPPASADGAIVFVLPTWDTGVGSQRVTIVTADPLQGDGDLGELSLGHLVQTSWGGRVAPVAVYLDRGTYLGYRIEETDVGPLEPRMILYATPQQTPAATSST